MRNLPASIDRDENSFVLEKRSTRILKSAGRRKITFLAAGEVHYLQKSNGKKFSPEYTG